LHPGEDLLHRAQVVALQVADRRAQLVDHQLHPQLGDLVLDDEQHLVVVRPAHRLLRLQQAVQPQVAAVGHPAGQVAVMPGSSARWRLASAVSSVQGVHRPMARRTPRRRRRRGPPRRGARLAAKGRFAPIIGQNLSADARGQARDDRRRQFEIEYLQYLGPTASWSASLPEAVRGDPAGLVPLFKQMLFVRSFDTKAVALQRTGKLGTYASCLGHEAAHVGIGARCGPRTCSRPATASTARSSCAACCRARC
jgi:hypothetical protein